MRGILQVCGSGMRIGIGVLCIAAGACSSGATSNLVRKGGGVEGVTDLVGWVERVGVDAEVARERATAALDALMELTAPAFHGDPVVAYGEFVSAVAASEKQAKRLGRSIRRMDRTANAVFDGWAEGLEGMASTELRVRSRKRLEETRERYRDLVLKAEPSWRALEEFDTALRDHAIFLGHDLNAAAIQSLAGEVRRLAARAAQLQAQLEASEEAARLYVANALPPGDRSGERAEGNP